MSKYSNLSSHLIEIGKGSWRASFSDVERILGFDLPASARQYPAWWANQSGKDHSQSFSWICVGWRTEDLDLPNEQVTFRYVGDELIGAVRGNRRDAISAAAFQLTIEQAKQGLSAKFGVPVEAIEITIKG